METNIETKKSRKGGYRPGAGRKPVISRQRLEDVLKARDRGELPHLFLHRVVIGELVDGEKPSLEMRVQCAIACAPYFAPRLASLEQKIEQRVATVSVTPLTPEQWVGMYGQSAHTLPNGGTQGVTQALPPPATPLKDAPHIEPESGGVAVAPIPSESLNTPIMTPPSQVIEVVQEKVDIQKNSPQILGINNPVLEETVTTLCFPETKDE